MLSRIRKRVCFFVYYLPEWEYAAIPETAHGQECRGFWKADPSNPRQAQILLNRDISRTMRDKWVWVITGNAPLGKKLGSHVHTVHKCMMKVRH